MVLSDSDRSLLNRCLVGADGSWEEFVDRYLPLISHVVTATSKVRVEKLPTELRDDMVAEVLLALVDDDFAILRRFRGQSSLGTYLVVVARRIVARRLTKLPDLQPLADEPAEVLHDPEFENAEEVQHLLQKLPEAEATVLRMYHLERKSYQDIADHLAIPANSVGPLLSKAREHMRSLR
jgi:RNA polymerase sigma-70 factor (ECF subfamily)